MDYLKYPPAGGTIDPFRKPKPRVAPRKVGIVFRTMRKGFFDFKIYVVDVDDSNSDFSEMKPAVRFKFPRVSMDVLTYCILNSTMYIFRGYNSLKRPGSGALPEKKKSAYKLVLSPQDLAAAGKVVETEQLTRIDDMCQGKGYPAALPTPDGKQILVFSTLFDFKESFEAFEVLNVDDDSWVALPKLPCHNCSLSDSSRSWCNCTSMKELVYVTAVSFIGKSIFYLETDMGAFALDLRKNEWTRVDNLLGAPVDGFGYLETVKGRYVIMAGWKSDHTLRVYDFGDDGFFGPKRDDDAPHAPMDVIQLSPLDPPLDSLWLEPLKPMLFPLRPEDEETACCFVVQQLEGVQTYEEVEEEMKQLEGPVEAEEDFVDMGEPELDEEEYYTMQKQEAVEPAYYATQILDSVEPEYYAMHKLEAFEYNTMQKLEAVEPEPDEEEYNTMQKLEAVEPEPDEEEYNTMQKLEAVEPEPDVEEYCTMQKLEAEKPESDEDSEENFEEIYDPRGETRILIEVCHFDLKSHPLKFNVVPNAVRVRIRFHFTPYDVIFFTL